MSNRPRTRRRGRSRQASRSQGPDLRLRMGLANALLAGSGVVVAVLGFWLLSTGSISAAPAILILAYLVLIPVGLALPRRREEPSQKRDAG